MKRIAFMILALLVTVVASAQYNNSAELYKKGGRLYLNGEKLDKLMTDKLLSDYSNEKGVTYSEVWKKANGMRTAGIVLTSTGAVSAVAGPLVFTVGLAKIVGTGLASAISGDPDVFAGEQEILAGSIIMGLSTAMLGSGIPLLCVGNKRMKNIVSGYNAQEPSTASGLTLAFGPCPSGVGLSLKF